MKGEAKFFASLKETPENGTKKPSAKPGTIGRWPKGKANWRTSGIGKCLTPESFPYG
jgi:hypothetical protein